jgi:hypothetical protein
VFYSIVGYPSCYGTILYVTGGIKLFWSFGNVTRNCNIVSAGNRCLQHEANCWYERWLLVENCAEHTSRPLCICDPSIAYFRNTNSLFMGQVNSKDRGVCWFFNPKPRKPYLFFCLCYLIGLVTTDFIFRWRCSLISYFSLRLLKFERHLSDIKENLFPIAVERAASQIQGLAG